jgi:hypothetical protein
MLYFKTLYTSNLAIECHILKGRLVSEGIDCFISNENMIGVHPFWAVALGGIKIQVPVDQVEVARRIVDLITRSKLIDDNGDYEVVETLDRAFAREKEVLSLKVQLRNNKLSKPISDFRFEYLRNEDVGEILESEKEFMQWSAQKLNFTWKQFWFELFDYDRSVFMYLRPRPVEYFLEKELTDNFEVGDTVSPALCPNCRSGNVVYGPAIDTGWNIPGLILSFLIHNPFPVYRKNHHCFDCGFNFYNLKILAMPD